MKDLFMIIHSPFERREVETLMKMVQAGDGIIFVKNGVFVNNFNDFPGNLNTEEIKIYGLEEDLIARGIKDWKYEVVDYDGFVDLITNYSKVIS